MRLLCGLMAIFLIGSVQSNNKDLFIDLIYSSGFESVLPSALRINFQSCDAGTPVGYKKDCGALYGARAIGFEYGWNVNAESDGRDRNQNNKQTLDTIIHYNYNANAQLWELKLPNGWYEVTVSIGDAGHPSVGAIDIEGLPFLAETSLLANQFQSHSEMVEVSDGRLSMTQGAGTNVDTTRVNFIHITPRNQNLWFEQDFYTFVVDAGTPVSTEIGTVNATELNSNPITYSIIENVPFSIDGNGLIVNNSLLNHNQHQNYEFTVVATSGATSIASVVSVRYFYPLDNAVTIARWNGISGTSIYDFLESPHYQDPADSVSYVPEMTEISSGNDFGQKLTTLLTVPQSGWYDFAVIGDDDTGLNLSMSGLPDDLVTVAEKKDWGSYQDWSSAGVSDSIFLETGRSYYLEAIHKEGSGGSHVSVGWKLNSSNQFVQIPATNSHQRYLKLEDTVPTFDNVTTQHLISYSTSIDTVITTINVSDIHNDQITFNIVGNVPFSIDSSGQIKLTGILPASGASYDFDVEATDGFHIITQSLLIQSTTVTAAMDALDSCDVTQVTEGELLQAAISRLDPDSTPSYLLTEMYGADPIDYNPGRWSQIFNSGISWYKTFPLIKGNSGKVFAVAGETEYSRFAAFGKPPTHLFNNGTSLSFEPSYITILSWLLSGEPIDSNILNTPLNITVSYTQSDEGNITNWFTDNYPNINLSVCNNFANLASCVGNADLVIIGSHGSDNEADAVVQILSDQLDAGTPILYLHSRNEGKSLLSDKIAELLGYQLPSTGNYWSQDSAQWNSLTDMYNAIWAPTGGAVLELLNHFQANDLSFDWNQCAGEDCSAVPGLNQTLSGLGVIRSTMNFLDESKLDLCQQTDYELIKLFYLLGDYYRQGIQFPMDKVTTDDNVFFKSYYADHAVYNYREINPVQPDMGNFSRSDFSHVIPINKSVNIESKVDFRSAGVYALPGQTFRVTRNDSSNVNVSIRVNTQRSGSTHQWQENGYKRPKFLKSIRVDINSGETIYLTSPYGGPLQIHFSQNDLPVELFFENVGEHPYWRGSQDDASFAQKMLEADYDWAEIATPSFEVHSQLSKMNNSIQQWGNASALAAGTIRYIHNYPHLLAGFEGDGIDVVAEVHDFANNNGFGISLLDKVKHMNADQANCGSGCSGNPYDAYWSFSPTNHGDLHELGHGLQSGRFQFSGWENHSWTNPYSYFSKTQFLIDTGIESSCQSIPFQDVFTLLQASILEADPVAFLQTNLWTPSGWSEQASMWLQIFMSAQGEGALENGWYVLARLHILERNFNWAKRNDTDWANNKDALGFSTYTRSEANNISNDDWLLIAYSKVTGLDYRDYFAMWGRTFNDKAKDQVQSFGSPAVPRRFYISTGTGFCQQGVNGDFLGKASMPVDGAQTWPANSDTDGDGYWDALDNCPNVYNPDQQDSNDNGIGDACE